MGPTNKALLELFRADSALREAQANLDAATRGVRVQRKRAELAEKAHAELVNRLKHSKAQQMELDSDLRARDARIEHLREQQQNAQNHKQFQNFLVEINTSKVDRNKVEEEAIKVLGEIEKMQVELKDLLTALENEKSKLVTMQGEITGKTSALQAEIDAIKPQRQAASQAVPPKAREAFDRLADRFDGEAMSPLIKPDRRREEYSCGACMMDLVRDVYNRLHVRDELVFCQFIRTRGSARRGC